MNDTRIVTAESAADIDRVRELFIEYARALSFHICFEGFQKELAQLPGAYASPGGRLLLGLVADNVAGCVAIKPADSIVCEMKRLYVRPAHRGSGLGRALATRAIASARDLGYTTMRLDTLPQMTAAQSLYKSLGFVVVSAPSVDPEEPIDMELKL